jgi:hypothetical protein
MDQSTADELALELSTMDDGAVFLVPKPNTDPTEYELQVTEGPTEDTPAGDEARALVTLTLRDLVQIANRITSLVAEDLA